MTMEHPVTRIVDAGAVVQDRYCCLICIVLRQAQTLDIQCLEGVACN